MVECVGRCPRCGGHTSTGNGMTTQLVYDDDGIIWEGDIGTESCTGDYDGPWAGYLELGEAERTGCTWSQRIGDVDAYDRAEAQARRSARAEVEMDY